MVNFIFANLVEQATVEQLENTLQVIDDFTDNERQIIAIRQMVMERLNQLKPK